MLVAMSSPKPAAVSLSAKINTIITTTSTTHRTSYWPLYTEVKEPMNQMPSCCSASAAKAKNEDTALTTAPSIMPTMGTTIDERRVTLRRNRKKIIVPMNANTTATIIFTRTEDCGNKIRHVKRPKPAHSVVPVVVGSTNRFCVRSCITSPQIAMAAPERISAMVRGMRVIPNISQPNSLVKMLYSPTDSENTSNITTPTVASVSFQFHSLPRDRRFGAANSGLVARPLASGDELTEFFIMLKLLPS